jgi:hypothetical protein
MSDQRLTCDTMSIEEAMVSNMWEMVAIILANTSSPDLPLRFTRTHFPLRPGPAAHVRYPLGGQAQGTAHSFFTL